MNRYARLATALTAASIFTYICWVGATNATECYVECGMGGMDLCPSPCSGLGPFAAAVIFLSVTVATLRALVYLDRGRYCNGKCRPNAIIDRYTYWS